ncbi:MAG: DUF503 domain-containing protein [Gemmatimonadetes bacterium]|nr:DUF503 domain-containing protein [Gemmatimonadota bacterium]
MVVAVVSWQLSLPGCGSLKEKRMVVKSLKDRLHHRFNVSVAETRHHDIWGLAELTASVVTTDRRHADSVLAELDRFVNNDGRAVVINTSSIFY